MAAEVGSTVVAGVRLLGPLEVTTGAGGRVGLGGPRQRTLLGLLALRAPDVVSRAQLIDGIWGEEPPASATKTLHAHMAYLRRALTGAGLPALITTRPPGYALAVGETDAQRFETLARQGNHALRSGAVTEAAELLRTGLRLWRGDVLADCPIGEWARAEAATLHEARWNAVEDLCAVELALGEHARVAAELETLVAREPLRERLWELLMTALHLAGRRADALAAYRRARGVLVAQLGIEPGRRLREVEAAVLAGESIPPVGPAPGRPAGDRSAGGGAAGERRAGDRLAGGGAGRSVADPATEEAAPPGWPTIAGPPLPAPLTRLIGRRAEVAEIGALLADHRLVTLTGIGGCGKTRLALAVAAELGAGDDLVVRFVELAGLVDPDRLVGTVGTALGLPDQVDPSPVDALGRQLRRARLLLVLDNCEHLATACAALVGTLLSRCPGLRVLATSREPLDLPGERAFPVAPLAVPTGRFTGDLAEARRYDAVRLFLDRAAVPVVRDLRDADAAALVAICAGLDGLPLAIELAATRTSVLTPREIADRLREPGLLRTGPGGAGRPSALDAAMAWSYHLLSPARQRWFRRLAVFRGGGTLDAVEAMAPGPAEEAIDVLGDLVARSLVVTDRHRGRARYRLLETIRHYAAERLAESAVESAEAYRCHAVHYRRLAEEVDRQLHGPELEALLDRLAVEHDNLVAAQEWHRRHGSRSEQLRLAAGLGRYCHLRGRYREGRRWLADALTGTDDLPAPELARACLSAAYLALFECDYIAATGHGERALQVHRQLADDSGSARALSLLGSVDREQGRLDRSLARYAEALTVHRAADNRRGIADTLLMTGFTAWLGAELDRAEPLVEAALAEFHQLADPEGIASARVHLAAVAYHRGQDARARWLAEDALSRFQEFGFQEGIAWALNIVGLVEARDGDRLRAAELLRGSLELHCAVGDRWRGASLLESLAAVLSADDRHSAAVELLGAASAIRAAIGAPVPAQEHAAHAATLDRVHLALTERAFYAAWARGESYRLEELPTRLRELVPTGRQPVPSG
ncbi:AfsR/SARP family transcriptional regulator [Micromonospora sp. RTGN7]|uniref:AfsR/SARP family transcriptional regulator n=1 Tax=Micromonospora sp. RTGN7 TaxID=3016526 RepID=UPI0029FEF88D|nr:BTAD domain-containing putative transcriptional regulator [Micromonospora sp. RTGN7]